MKRFAAGLISTALGASLVLVAAPAEARSPYCGLRWGSTPEQAGVTSGPDSGEVTDVRTGRHACFDRVVLDVSGDPSGYVVRYVDQVHRDGSGFLVPLRGGARLEIVAMVPTSPTDSWFTPTGELANTSHYRTFRQLAWAGSFEGQTTLGLGVRARLPFRVLTLDGPGTGSRLVVDVAHRW